MNALALTGQGRKRGCAIPVLGSAANVAKADAEADRNTVRQTQK
jgi:hypothetical protein